MCQLLFVDEHEVLCEVALLRARVFVCPAVVLWIDAACLSSARCSNTAGERRRRGHCRRHEEGPLRQLLGTERQTDTDPRKNRERRDSVTNCDTRDAGGGRGDKRRFCACEKADSRYLIRALAPNKTKEGAKSV